MSFNVPALRQAGFTLVELIVAIVIIGVLAVVAAPRFADTSGYAEFTYQKRALAALRNIQYKAMQDTRDGFCHQLNFDVGASPAFGPPTTNYASSNQSATCSSAISFTTSPILRTEPGEISQDKITLAVTDSTGAAITSIGFDNFGRPNNADCSVAGCVVSFTGQQPARICVSAQGWIHGC